MICDQAIIDGCDFYNRMRVSLVQCVNRGITGKLTSEPFFPRADNRHVSIESFLRRVEDGPKKVCGEMQSQCPVRSEADHPDQKSLRILGAQVHMPNNKTTQKNSHSRRTVEESKSKKLIRTRGGYDRYPVFREEPGHSERRFDSMNRADAINENLMETSNRVMIGKQPSEEEFKLYDKCGPPVPDRRISYDQGLKKHGEFEHHRLVKEPRPNILYVTHNEIAAVTEKGILRIFRRFGRVLSLKLDQNQKFWSVQYGYPTEAYKARKAVAIDKLYGYKFYQEEGLSTPFSLVTTADEQRDRRPVTSFRGAVIIREFKDLELDSQYTIQIVFADDKVQIEAVCRLLTRKHRPLSLSQGYDTQKKQILFIAAFELLSQAAETLMYLTQDHLVLNRLI